MSKGSNHARSHFRNLIWATMIFGLVYIAIHFFLNLAAQSASGNELLDWKKMVVYLAGPITIGLCSSLLILSFGTFMIHGLEDISVSAPWAFTNAFVIFIIGQILVQLTGHLEIYLLNSSQTLTSGSLTTLIFMSLCYPAAFGSLYALESYSAKVWASLNPQLPEQSRHHADDAKKLLLYTGLSIFLLAAKPVVLWADWDAKLSVSLYALAIELGLTCMVVRLAFQASKRHNEQREQTS